MILGPSRSLCDCVNEFKDHHTDNNQGIIDNHGRLHWQLSRTGVMLPYQPFGYNQKGKQENDYILLLVFGWNTYSLLDRSLNGVGIGVGVDIFKQDSETESELLFVAEMFSWLVLVGTVLKAKTFLTESMVSNLNFLIIGDRLNLVFFGIRITQFIFVTIKTRFTILINNT